LKRISVLVIALILVGCAGAPEPSGDVPPTVISGEGANVAAQVDAYRAAFGGQNNGGAPGDFDDGYREVNWDSIPDELSAPNDYQPDFFNAKEDPRARGMLLTSEGTLRVSADSDNPTGTLPRFGDLNPTYADIFKPFSEERMFSPVGSNIVDITFFVPGTDTPGLVRGFGAIYTDVDTEHTAFEYFDAAGNSLGAFGVPLSNNGVSFLGVVFEDAVVFRVRVTYGTVSLGPDDSTENDVAVMDNFIYGEPQPMP
jgi:hypothetical protein